MAVSGGTALRLLPLDAGNYQSHPLHATERTGTGGTAVGGDRSGTTTSPLSGVVWFPDGLLRPVEAELGLTAVALPAPEGSWELEVATRRCAQSVTIDAPGWRPTDSWFHLEPGGSRVIRLIPESTGSGFWHRASR
jgi:hypothetical protein